MDKIIVAQDMNNVRCEASKLITNMMLLRLSKSQCILVNVVNSTARSHDI